MRPVKTYDYIVALKRSSSQSLIDWLSRLMIFIAVVVFMYEGMLFLSRDNTVGLGNSAVLYFVFSAVILSWWTYCIVQQRRGFVPYYRFALMIAAWGWFIHPNGYFLCILYLVAAVLEKPVKVQPEIAFDENEISINSFTRKSFSWNEMNNVVLKDGILTVDFKNNKLIQREVNDAVSKEVEAAFNNFCQKQLTAIS